MKRFLAILASLCLLTNAASASRLCVITIGDSNSYGHGDLSEWPAGSPVNGRSIWNYRYDGVLERNPAEPINDPMNYTPTYSAYERSKEKLGVGHGLRFADTVLALGYTGSVVTIPCARGGIRHWARNSDVSTSYGACLARMQQLEAAHPCTTKVAIITVGGAEARQLTDANMVQERTEALIDSLRLDHGNDLIVGYFQVGDSPTDPDYPYYDVVRAEQASINRPNAVMIPSVGLAMNEDGLHWTTATQRTLGRRMANRMFNLGLLPIP